MGVSMATYTPQPGTIAARVLAWFSEQPPEREASSGVIAEALDQPIAAVITALEPVFEHGLIAREKREGRLYWSVSRANLRPLFGPPAVSADDDEIDDAPIVRRFIPATQSSGVSLVDRPAWTAPKEPTMTTPALTPPQPKKARVAAPAFDPLAIELKKDRPLPPVVPGSGSRYKALLERMVAGDSVDLPTAAAKSIVSTAKKLGVKVAVRVISAEVSGVWRL